jgi:hypothetical protein
VRLVFHFEARYQCSSRLSATLSDHGQVLGRHTFSNGFRVVSHFSRRNPPVATLSQAIETFDGMDFSSNLESHGVLFPPLHLRFGTHIKSKNLLSMSTPLTGAPHGPP